MKLKICTPQKLILDEDVDSVTLPGALGQMTILPKHASFVGQLGRGEVYYRQREKKVNGFQLDGGFVEVQNNTVLIMTKNWQVSATNPLPH